MKKLVAFMMALIMVLSLAACGSDEETPAVPEASAPASTPTANESVEANFQSNDGKVTSLDVVQVMGKGLNTDSGELFRLKNKT